MICSKFGKRQEENILGTMKKRKSIAFKDILTKERLQRGWTQQYMAEQVGVDKNTVSRWERDVSSPTLSIQPQLCALLGMTTQELGLFSDIAPPSEVEANIPPDGAVADIAMQLLPTDISTDHTIPSTPPPLPVPPDSPSIPIIASPSEPRNPYKGLRAFHQEDARDFFGRDELIQGMISHLRHLLTRAEEQADTARFLAIIGPSGCGKSSVVQAGVMPRLQADAITSSEVWTYLLPMTPGKHPITALAIALDKYMIGSSIESLCDELNKPAARGLHMLARQIADQPAAKVVLVVDQFEELFTQTEDETERQQFIDVLLTACTEPGGVVIVLLTLRADFYDRPMAYRQLGQLIEQQHETVFPLSVSELLAVIEQPAALDDVQITFEDSLVRDMLLEMQGQHNALPLLQFTLDQLFQRRAKRLLTHHTYEEIGGIRGALSLKAEQIYESLPSKAHRDLARALFLRLIDLGGTEQETTRLSIALNTFTFAYAVQTQMMREVITAFTEARLLTTSQGDDKASNVEISHEALIRAWPHYMEWQREFRWDAHMQRSINRDATAWVQYGKRRDRLYRSTQLSEAQLWAQRNVPNEQELTFLQASIGRRKRVRMFGTLIALLVIVAILPFTASLFGIRTFFSSPVPPGGWWVSPLPNQYVHDELLFEAHAYPGAPTEPGIAYVEFTMRWYEPGTSWFTACHLTKPTSDNIFACTLNLHTMGAPSGRILISFNVYDVMGNFQQAPNGVHSIYYSPSS